MNINLYFLIQLYLSKVRFTGPNPYRISRVACIMVVRQNHLPGRILWEISLAAWHIPCHGNYSGKERLDKDFIGFPNYVDFPSVLSLIYLPSEYNNHVVIG